VLSGPTSAYVPMCIKRLVAQRDVLVRCSVRGHVGVEAGDLGWSEGIARDQRSRSDASRGVERC
jgi:hypothetical protein